MRIENGVIILTSRNKEIMDLLVAGNSQAEVAELMNFSRPYINQVVKGAVSFGILEETKDENKIRIYRYLGGHLDLSKVDILKIPIKISKITTIKKCLNCNKPLEKSVPKNSKFCNQICRAEYMIGPRSANWKGGYQKKTYCYKFNKNLKERVRAFFKYKCFACGCAEGDQALSIHHVLYNPMACCDGGGIPLFVPLCQSCHGRTNRNDENNFWEKLFYNQLMERTNGKCYFTKREWRKISIGEDKIGSKTI